MEPTTTLKQLLFGDLFLPLVQAMSIDGLLSLYFTSNKLRDLLTSKESIRLLCKAFNIQSQLPLTLSNVVRLHDNLYNTCRSPSVHAILFSMADRAVTDGDTSSVAIISNFGCRCKIWVKGAISKHTSITDEVGYTIFVEHSKGRTDGNRHVVGIGRDKYDICLLYTSDAADE